MDTCHAHPTAWAKLEGQHAPRLPARRAHGTSRPRTCRHRQSRHCRPQAAVIPSTSSQHVCPAEEAEHNQSSVPVLESEGRGKLGLLQQRGVIAKADKASYLPAWHQACMLTSTPLRLQMALQIAFVISWRVGVPAQLHGPSQCTSAGHVCMAALQCCIRSPRTTSCCSACMCSCSTRCTLEFAVVCGRPMSSRAPPL